jgi:hypothetical protein
MSASAQSVRALAQSVAAATGDARQEAGERLLVELRTLADARLGDALREVLADRVLENLTASGGQSIEIAALNLLRKLDPQAGFELERARVESEAAQRDRVARFDGFLFASLFALSQAALMLLPLKFWHVEGFEQWGAVRAGAALLTGVGLLVSTRRPERVWSLAAVVAALGCGASAVLDAWRLANDPHSNFWNLVLLGAALCPAWASAALHATRGTAMRSWRGKLAVLASSLSLGAAAAFPAWSLGFAALSAALLGSAHARGAGLSASAGGARRGA